MKSKLNFSLTQLEYVVAVHKLGHFGKAAEACHVTQSTLSMQIQKLEEEFGVTLFDRSLKPCVLTESGEKLIEQIQTILFEARKIVDLIGSSQTDATQGSLSIGIIPTVAPYLLPRLLPILESNFPHLELQISEMQTHRIIEELERDGLDVGLLATPLGISKIHEQALYYEPFYVLCGNNHELSQRKRIRQSELKLKDIWLLAEGHCLRNQILDVCTIKQERGFRMKYRFESGSLETLKQLVDSYGGYTLLPYLATESIGPNSQVIPFERPIPAREIGLVYRRQHHKTILIGSLARGIADCLPSDLRKMRQKDLDVLPVER
ncbi:MAG: hydrogen peroxide-inducible genes activator [Bdellovibrionales bacterium]|nr:hydrogen peroxide-inducible genes activator [Bdellovibrionales bacterium]